MAGHSADLWNYRLSRAPGSFFNPRAPERRVGELRTRQKAGRVPAWGTREAQQGDPLGARVYIRAAGGGTFFTATFPPLL